jgi:ubiquinone/menaquinone biosynthesis C-methylase UbiE
MSFDRLARHYRWMEFILAGSKLQRCRTMFLQRVRGVRNILIGGEGNGRFLGECFRHLPNARITVLDASAKMMDIARQRLDRRLDLGRVEFVHADARMWTPSGGPFDLIVTHFFLDCFPEDQLHGVVANLAKAAAQDATWLLADFQMPDRGISRFRAQLILAMMYLFFRVATRLPARRLTPADAFLEAHRFVLRERRETEWGLLRAELWSRRERHAA